MCSPLTIVSGIFLYQTPMNVCLGKVDALNYATTQLEATHVLVTLAMYLIPIIMHAMVSFLHCLYCQSFSYLHN